MGLRTIFTSLFKQKTIRIGDLKLKLNTANRHEKQYYQSIVNDDYVIASLFIKPDFNVLDLGANIGFTALVYLKFGAQHVTCFEPIPELAGRIRNIKSNQIVVIEKATGNEVGVAEIFKSTTHNQGHSLNSQWPERFKNVFSNTQIANINITTLDTEFSNEIFDFIKIDVEGYELNTIKGAELFLKRNREAIIQIEIYDWQFIETHELLSHYFDFTYVPIINNSKIERLISIKSYGDVEKVKFSSAPNYLYANRELIFTAHD